MGMDAWAVTSSVLGGLNLVVLLKLAFDSGKLVQKVEDIEHKGCEWHRQRNEWQKERFGPEGND